MRHIRIIVLLLLAPARDGPLADIAVLAGYDNNIQLVVRDGEIFKYRFKGVFK